ncbi:hypothetical protein [Bradyrhizobium sp. CCBAU 51627]|uniref:hypothetical protein n=1 Tax=Bradyrhizobium sp. CCBAU 51627 TaxID=1325088 RepID=UPI0023063C1C|nr:hypothetical protein [Bradyrhizobium sp. CCBAU 51627]
MTLAMLALATSLAAASGAAQAANVSVEGDGNDVTVVENHYHISNQYNVQRDYDDSVYYPRSYGPRYYGYYPQPYVMVRPMLPAPMPFFFRYGMRGFYR